MQITTSFVMVREIASALLSSSISAAGLTVLFPSAPHEFESAVIRTATQKTLTTM